MGTIVEDLPASVELVLSPVPFIGDLAVLVVELCEAVHFIFLPLSLIVSAITIV